MMRVVGKQVFVTEIAPRVLARARFHSLDQQMECVVLGCISAWVCALESHARLQSQSIHLEMVWAAIPSLLCELVR